MSKFKTLDDFSAVKTNDFAWWDECKCACCCYRFWTSKKLVCSVIDLIGLTFKLAMITVTEPQPLKCWGMSAAFETEEYNNQEILCSVSIMTNINNRCFSYTVNSSLFLHFDCIFGSVARSTVSVCSQFTSCKRKLSNVVSFDLYHTATQHSSVNNKGKTNQSHCLALSHRYTAGVFFVFFLLPHNLFYNQGCRGPIDPGQPVLL